MKDSIKIEELAEKPSNWDEIVSHPLQTWAWGEFREAMGVDVVRLGAYDQGKLIQGWQMTFHKVPKLPYVIGYFPKGPDITSAMLRSLQHLGKRKKAIFIQLEPNIQINQSTNQLINKIRPSHHPLFTKYTFTLDLSLSEEELLKNMHQKTRYNIRIAEKHGVSIQEDSTEQAFSEYLRLTQETTDRQGFYAHTPKYHKTMWKTLSKNGIAKLFTATYQGKTLATWIIFCFNNILYYPYGASSRDNREVMAPSLLLWEIAKWGKHNGYTSFDLWGAMGPTPDTNDPWYGFHRFKEGFHPELQEFVGSYDLVIHPILYPLYCLADDLRWKILRARKK